MLTVGLELDMVTAAELPRVAFFASPCFSHLQERVLFVLFLYMLTLQRIPMVVSLQVLLYSRMCPVLSYISASLSWLGTSQVLRSPQKNTGDEVQHGTAESWNSSPGHFIQTTHASFGPHPH